MSEIDQTMLQITTAVSKKTSRARVMLAQGSPSPDGAGGPVYTELDPVEAELNAVGLMDVLIEDDDTATVGLSLPSGVHSVSVKDAKWIIATLFRASQSASVENNFAEFMVSEVGMTPSEALHALLQFREFNARHAEDSYNKLDTP